MEDNTNKTEQDKHTQKILFLIPSFLHSTKTIAC